MVVGGWVDGGGHEGGGGGYNEGSVVGGGCGDGEGVEGGDGWRIWDSAITAAEPTKHRCRDLEEEKSPTTLAGNNVTSFTYTNVLGL